MGRGVLIGGVVLAGIALAAAAGAAEGGPNGGGGGGGPGGEGCFDADMPDSVRTELLALLQKPDAKPWQLDDAADSFGAYPSAAACLRAKAREIRQTWELRDRQQGYSEYTLRYGDLAGKMAAHYTGDGSRWKEVAPLNAHRGMKNTSQGPTPWFGKVRLPLSWAIWAKRPIVPASGAPPGQPEPVDVPAGGRGGPGLNPDAWGGCPEDMVWNPIEERCEHYGERATPEPDTPNA